MVTMAQKRLVEVLKKKQLLHWTWDDRQAISEKEDGRKEKHRILERMKSLRKSTAIMNNRAYFV